MKDGKQGDVLTGLTLSEIEKITDSLHASKFRARQIHNWVYLKSAASIDDMSDLSKSFREELKKVTCVSTTKIVKKQESTDGTIKYLVEFADGQSVETVLMRFDNRANLTACVSSQIGCAVGCNFCATGKQGFIRNLTYAEILDQVLTIQRDTGLKVTNVVFMGQGEPLLNLENVLKAIEIFNESFQIGARRLTVSTSGIIPGINKLAKIGMQSTLAVSLHAPSHEVRAKLMEIENKYNMDELKKTLKNYTDKTGRRITIEYLLIKDVNDRVADAAQLARYIEDIKCNVNLIPYNCVGGVYEKPSGNAVMRFKSMLEQGGKKVTIRLERGADIDAACGQLRGAV
jgi:23S rRNA (adenine2503-C2)-methyltransferase